jgi:ribosomal-protein-alanine N-acetyltransferase
MSAREIDAPSGVLIRRMTAADLPRVVEIETASFTVPWRLSTFRGLLTRHDADLLAAEAAGELVGYAVVWTILEESELGNVAVAQDRRGRGTGRLLIETALGHARARGSRECFLEVRASNRAARTLYETMGFEVVGRRRAYYTRPVEDALVMRVELL